MWSDAARASSMQARSGQGAAQGGALQAGLAAAGATNRGAWAKGNSKGNSKGGGGGGKRGGGGKGGGGGKSGGATDKSFAAHQRGVNAVQPNLNSGDHSWAYGNVADNAYANGPRPLVPTGDGGYRYQFTE